jgi:hypothetical protein
MIIRVALLAIALQLLLPHAILWILGTPRIFLTINLINITKLIVEVFSQSI